MPDLTAEQINQVVDSMLNRGVDPNSDLSADEKDRLIADLTLALETTKNGLVQATSRADAAIRINSETNAKLREAKLENDKIRKDARRAAVNRAHELGAKIAKSIKDFEHSLKDLGASAPRVANSTAPDLPSGFDEDEWDE